MKREITISLLISTLLCLLCGCGMRADETSETETGTEQRDSYVSNLDASAIAAMEGKDNAKDAYSFVANMPLKTESPDGALSGGGSALALGNARAFSFKKHLFGEFEQCWDEIAIVTREGEETSIRREIRDQIWGIGSVYGTDHYIVHQVRSGVNTLLELDEENRTVREIHLECFDGEELTILSGLMTDEAGNIHFTIYDSEAGEARYCIASSEGELLVDGYTESGFSISRLVSLHDGRVAFEAKETVPIGEKIEEREKALWYLDVNTGETALLASVVETYSEKYDGLTLFDAENILYANTNGIYCRNMEDGSSRLLYLWANHGIVNPELKEMRSFSDGGIAAIYENQGENHYIYLKPTVEQTEITELVMAVSPAMEKTYRSAVAKFNKRYPSVHIEMKTDYDETVLLTELIAGNGPVLIDTTLTGFRNQEKLWEPLDGVLEELGILGELNAGAMEQGKIGDSFYGIVPDFYLQTVVTGEDMPKSWDYETFLQCIKDQPELEAVMNSNSVQDGWYFISSFLIRELEDNYLFDAGSGKTHFDSKAFGDILDIAEEYCERQDYVYPGTGMSEGKVLCNVLSVSKPVDLEVYRRVYGENANFIGFPTKDGSTHYLSGRLPVTIRRTADEEEKEAACAFVSLLLSYECQSELAENLNFGMSVRKDVLQEQIDAIAAMDADTLLNVNGFETMKLGEDADAEADGELLYSLLEMAEAKKSLPSGLLEIMTGELENYFAGITDKKTVIKNLTNRVELYLSEQQ